MAITPDGMTTEQYWTAMRAIHTFEELLVIAADQERERIASAFDENDPMISAQIRAMVP